MESTSVNKLIESIAAELGEMLHPTTVQDAKLVQKGLMLYRQGLVTQLRFWDDAVTATVQDVTPVKVRLDFNFLTASECSCPEEGLCRHQLAVFFSAYSRSGVGSVGDWVAEWREPIREQKAVATWGIQTAKDLVKANSVMKPDYSRWVQSFEVSFDTLLATKKYTSPYVIPELYRIYERRIHASAPVEQEWRLLYELVAAVVSFRKLAVLSEQLSHTEEIVNRAYLHLFENLLDDTEELVGKISVQTMPFAFDEFIEKLKDDVFELLTAVRGLEYERIYLYRLLWVDFFKKKPWREEELEKIRRRGKELQDWENPVPLAVATIHLSLLLQNDERALKLMENMEDDLFTPYLVFWIDYLNKLKAWKRVEPLIELFLKKVQGYLAHLDGYRSCSVFSRNVIQVVTPFCTENERTDLYERALLALLPYSMGDYEYLLFERKQYDRWGELLAFVDFEYYDLPKDRLKTVEKDQPEVLLAMLHQTTQREIDQKNRTSYRMAVRHLKKLRTLYKKLKRVDDWQYFLENLLERTRRLRAFHEECRRSKLIEE